MKNLPDDQKIISIQEMETLGLTPYKIRMLTKKGDLIKLNKQYYENQNYAGEDSEFYYVRAYAPKGVICLLSAAVYYNLTVYIPDAIDVAIPRKSKVSSLPEWPPMTIHYFMDERHKLGWNEIRHGKNLFRIYDIEKTVVDIVFYKEKIGIEETKEILTSYLMRKDRNLDKLLQYAKALKCEPIMRQYLEILL
jgi:predicted transcriptional regulator of viral defense system